MRVALLFGGRSGEHEVSVVSARSVRRALDEGGHETVPMAIDHDGRWADPDTSLRVLDASGDRADRVVPFDGGDGLHPQLRRGEVDVVFPVLHGTFGEDGAVQGLLEMLDLPYVGCGVAASAVCMDKVLTKRVLEAGGVATSPWRAVDLPSWRDDRDAVLEGIEGLTYPLFVKPGRLGSSVGVVKVDGPDELPEALDEAFRYDGHGVVEEGIDGRELEVAVLGNRRPEATAPGEIVPGDEFYSYRDKYLDDSCELLAPAPMEPPDVERARAIALDAYRLLGCEGMARVDLFLATDGAFIVNEVNTIPGFTSISMYPKLWEAEGVSYPELVDRLLELGLERHRRESDRVLRYADAL